MLKIYIANLGKYNEGELVGKWVELPCEDLDEVLKEIKVLIYQPAFYRSSRDLYRILHD